MKRPILLIGLFVFVFGVFWNVWEQPRQETLFWAAEQRLAQASDEAGAFIVAGTVRACGSVSQGMRYLLDELMLVEPEGTHGQSVQREELGAYKLFVVCEDRSYEPGDRLLVSGRVQLWETAGNPGQFDARAYYLMQDILGTLQDARALEAQKRRPGLPALLYRLRSRLQDSYEQILEEPDAGTIAAISLGEKSAMDHAVKLQYQEGGISHIASVSGLHVSLVGAGVYWVLRRCLIGIGASSLLSGALAFLYVLLTGSTVSGVRALLMFWIWLLARAFGRKYDGKTSITAAFCVLLLSEPGYLRNSSFLLSFGAVAAILMGNAAENAKVHVAVGRGYVAALWFAILQGAVLWLGMLPLTLYFFYQTPPWSILVNLAVVPLMSFVLGLGLLSGGVGLVSVPFGIFLAAPVHYLLQLFGSLCDFELRLPGALQIAGRPSAIRIVFYYAVLFLTIVLDRRLGQGSGARTPAGRKRTDESWQTDGCEPSAGRWRINDHELSCSRKWSGGKKNKVGRRLPDRRESPDCTQILGDIRRRKCLLWCGCAMLCLWLMRKETPGDLEVLCMDVGQGDGALLQMPAGEVCMIDGGSTTETGIWEYRIGQSVKYYGIDTIDYLFLSHADADHISGVKEFLNTYETGLWGKNIHGITLKHLVLPPTSDAADFSEMIRVAAEKGIQVSRMAAGASVRGEDWSLSCLAPGQSQLTGDRNEDSMVLMLQYGAFRMLFTGDLEGEAEQRLAIQAGSEISLRADVLKVGHHGSKNASSEEFLAQVLPQAAVISCAAENRYGHPAPETLERLAQCGSTIYSTAESGAALVRSDGETFTVESYAGPDRRRRD